jgi:hypothetical protein
MSIESEITALREAIERLTAAITGHAETRLAIFNRAGEEALDAIPFNGAEIAALINAEAQAERQAEAKAVAANDDTHPAPSDSPLLDEPAPVEVTHAQVRERAVELLKRGGRDQLQSILVNELGAGKLDQLDAEQRRAALARIESLLAEAA